MTPASAHGDLRPYLPFLVKARLTRLPLSGGRAMKRWILAAIAAPALGACATVNNGAAPTTTRPQTTIVVPPTAIVVPPTAPHFVPPTTSSPLVPAGFTITTSGDVWLKSGPGSAFGNVVVAHQGDQVLVTCYKPNGQPDTTSSGITNSGWYQTIYDGNSGWISENYLNTQPPEGSALVR